MIIKKNSSQLDYPYFHVIKEVRDLASLLLTWQDSSTMERCITFRHANSRFVYTATLTCKSSYVSIVLIRIEHHSGVSKKWEFNYTEFDGLRVRVDEWQDVYLEEE